ncbi:MAG: MFS transporter [Bryobacteraceae bacterium]
MSQGAVSLRAYARLLARRRNYRLLWMAQTVSEIGDWFYAVAIYSLLLEITGKATPVAIAVVLQVLPQAFVSPLAGALGDRLSRRRVMIFADLARALIVALMFVAQSGQWLWMIYGLLFFETIMWALFEPARTATIPNLTENEHETAVANALSSTTWSFNFAVGFFLGGIVAAQFGRSTVLVINVFSFLLSAALLARMRFEERHLSNAPPFRVADLVSLAPMAEGLRYVAADRRRLATMLCKAGIGLLGANWVILPILGERVFPLPAEGRDAARAGMFGMSLLLGSRGLGAVLGPLTGAYLAGSDARRMRLGILFGFLAIGAGYVLLSGAPSIGYACATLVLAHGGASVVWVFSTTLLHYQTEDRFRGRVFSADFACLTVTMATVITAAGLAIDRGVPVRDVVLVTGLLAALPAGLWAFAGLPLWRSEPPESGRTLPRATDGPAAPPSV